MRTVYFMAKEGIPDSKFSSLVKLQQINQCPSFTKAQVYSHHESVTSMEEALAETVKKNLRRMTEESPFVGLLIDETVNVTVHKKLIVFLRILVDGKPKTFFVGNFTVTAGDADSLLKAYRNF